MASRIPQANGSMEETLPPRLRWKQCKQLLPALVPGPGPVPVLMLMLMLMLVLGLVLVPVPVLVLVLAVAAELPALMPTPTLPGLLVRAWHLCIRYPPRRPHHVELPQMASLPKRQTAWPGARDWQPVSVSN